METRKLQQVGGGTFTVSIPKEWAVEHGLEAGSTIHLYDHADGSIVVRSAEKDGDALGTILIELEGDAPDQVGRALGAAHAVGYETVTLHPHGTFTDAQRRAANRAKRHLVGTEVVVGSDDEIILRNLLDASDVSVRQSVVQLQFVACSAHRRATASFVDGADVDRDRLRERADEADRLYEMITRHLSRSLVAMEEVDRLGVGRPRLFDYYTTARELADVAGSSVSIGRAAERLSGPIDDEIAADVGAAAETSREIVDQATTAVLDGLDVDAANDILDQHDEALAELETIERALFDASDATFDGSTADARALTRVFDDLVLTVERGGAIAEVALRVATRVDAE